MDSQHSFLQTSLRLIVELLDLIFFEICFLFMLSIAKMLIFIVIFIVSSGIPNLYKYGILVTEL